MPFIWVPKKKSNSIEEQSKARQDPQVNKKVSALLSDKFKQSVAATYLSTGRNTYLTSRLTGVPISTIKYWRKSPWWSEYEKEILDQSNQETANKLQQVINKSLDQVMERLEKGDHILDSKTGKILRVPIKGKELNQIITNNIAKKTLLDNLQSQKVEKKNEEKQAETLLRLAEKFAQIASGKSQNEIRTITESIGEAHVIYDHKMKDAITSKDLKNLDKALNEP